MAGEHRGHVWGNVAACRVELHCHGDMKRIVERFAEAGHLVNLRRLSFTSSRDRDSPWVRRFVTSPHLASVVDLSFGWTELASASFKAILASPHLRGLRRLRFSRWRFPDSPSLREALEERFGSALRID